MAGPTVSPTAPPDGTAAVTAPAPGAGTGADPGRRAVLLGLAGLAGAAAVTAGGRAATAAWRRSGQGRRPLLTEAVGIRADGGRVGVPAGWPDAFFPGSRVLAGSLARTPGATAAIWDRRAEETAWLAAGSSPGIGTRWAGLARTALLDLRCLLLDGGALVAGWPGPWHYVWPRDASFGAAALAATGHHDDARAVLGFLQRVQAADGRFQARYRPDGSGPPDGRGVQLDGTGWVLWALDRAVAADPDPDALLAGLGPLLDRSTAAALAAVRTRSGLPPPSPDYWEVPETAPTLGTAAALLAGLHAAARLHRRTGRAGAAAVVAAEQAAARLDRAVTRLFAPDYPRHPGESAADAAVAFLLAPFGTGSDPGRQAAFEAAAVRLRRPAGGLAPGSGWVRDGISWTPETAAFALAAAGSRQPDEAAHWLDWLDAHRTPAGSVPEKVLYDGTPAGPAPLCWTAACLVLAAHQLG